MTGIANETEPCRCKGMAADNQCDTHESKSLVPVAAKTNKPHMKIFNMIPNDILECEPLNEAIKSLPHNYNFEIHKTIWQIRKYRFKNVALQFPEGLLLFSTTISDIIRTFCPEVDTFIMGDVTYGACCIDDYTAKAFGCDFLVHYGHSCLVTIDTTLIKTLYVFVDIKIDTTHLIDIIKANFQTTQKLAFVGTIQFGSVLQKTRHILVSEHNYNVVIPQSKPLSPGEILGCTSPKLDKDIDALICLGDGRFHLESILISNPELPAYRYDPYSKKLTREYYEHDEMYRNRKSAIAQARNAQHWGLILGTLGRQGSLNVLDYIEKKLKSQGKKYTLITLSEVTSQKLALFPMIDCWIQTSCPRLSIDWGHFFAVPVLSPYEATVALNQVEFQKTYPMDFYAKNSLGRWTPNHVDPEEERLALEKRRQERNARKMASEQLASQA